MISNKHTRNAAFWSDFKFDSIFLKSTFYHQLRTPTMIDESWTYMEDNLFILDQLLPKSDIWIHARSLFSDELKS